MVFHLYILQSEKDSGFYVGISSDVYKRLQAHNAGTTCSTKGRRPFKLVYTEILPDRVTARQREKYLKSYAGVAEKRKILKNCGIV